MKKKQKVALLKKGAMFVIVGIVLILALAKITPGMEAGRVACWYGLAALWVAVGAIAPFVHGGTRKIPCP